MINILSSSTSAIHRGSDSFVRVIRNDDILWESYVPVELTGELPLEFVAFGDPIYDWTLYGKTVQNGTPTPDAPIDIQGVGDRTSNLFDKNGTVVGNILSDGTIGTNQGFITSAYISVTPNTNYAASYLTTAYRGRAVAFYQSDKTFISTSLNNIESDDGTAPFTFATPDNCYFIRISTLSQANHIDELMCNLGSTALPYEPYGYKVTTTNRGKNLLNFEKWLIDSGATYTKEGNTFTFDSVQSMYSQPYYFSDTDITISISGEIETVTATNPRIHLVKADGTRAKSDAISTTATKRENISCAGFRFDWSVGGRIKVTILQIEEGATATAYEPYREPISTTLYTDKPLYGTGTNLDYLQRLADGSGVEHRAWGVITLTGNGNYYDYSYNSTNGIRVSNVLPVSYDRAQGYCNIYPVKTSAGTTHCLWIGGGGGDRNLYFVSILDDMGLTSAEEFKAYLAAQYAAGTPVTVVYPLATPTNTPITLPAIATAEGTNIIDTDTTVKGSARIKGRIQEVTS